MKIEVFPLGPLEANCFILFTDREAIAVDPGGPPQAVVRFLEKNSLALTHILCTHLHFDHTMGIAPLVAATGARVLASDKDGWMLRSELGQGGVWGMPQVEPFTFENLEPGDLAVLGTTCKVLATPGHTPGGLSFYFKELNAVFSGDALFYRSIGRTDFEGGDLTVLLSAIRKELFGLPESTIVYPGHGPETSVGDEKHNNPYASDFSKL